MKQGEKKIQWVCPISVEKQLEHHRLWSENREADRVRLFSFKKKMKAWNRQSCSLAVDHELQPQAKNFNGDMATASNSAEVDPMMEKTAWIKMVP